MVRGSELLINVVKPKQPKMLIGCSQNDMGPDVDALSSSHADVVAPANRQYLTHSLACMWNVGNLKLPGYEAGNRAVTQSEEAGGVRWQRKRRPGCNGQDRANHTQVGDTHSERMQTSAGSRMVRALVRIFLGGC